MTPSTAPPARRSSRVFLRLRVVASGKNQERRRFREACETIVINAHGGLLYLSQPLEEGLLVVLTNPFTQEEQECRIVYLGSDSEKASAWASNSYAGAALLGRRIRAA